MLTGEWSVLAVPGCELSSERRLEANFIFFFFSDDEQDLL